MAFSLRIPPALEADARARCDRLGVSLNALLCVALDSYLRGPEPASAVLGLGPVPATCTTSEASISTAPVPEPVPRKKPVLTAPPFPAPESAPATAAPVVLDRAERRRLERLARKKR